MTVYIYMIHIYKYIHKVIMRLEHIEQPNQQLHLWECTRTHIPYINIYIMYHTYTIYIIFNDHSVYIYTYVCVYLM